MAPIPQTVENSFPNEDRSNVAHSKRSKEYAHEPWKCLKEEILPVPGQEPRSPIKEQIQSDLVRRKQSAEHEQRIQTLKQLDYTHIGIILHKKKKGNWPDNVGTINNRIQRVARSEATEYRIFLHYILFILKKLT